ncbi:MAG: hypothetical protein ABIG10_00165 [bacterium]
MRNIDLSLPRQLLYFGGGAFILAAAFWGIWALTGAELPLLESVQPHWARIFAASDPWIIPSIYQESRYYDLVCFPLWVIMTISIFHYLKEEYHAGVICMGFSLPGFAAILLAWPAIIIFSISVINLIFGDSFTFTDWSASIFKVVEMVVIVTFMFAMPVIFFGSLLSFALIICTLYGFTFGFAAAFVLFSYTLYVFVPYYILRFLIKKIYTFIKNRKAK